MPRKKKDSEREEPAVPRSEGAAASSRSQREERRLTPIDIQQKEFRGARWGRGYNEGDVDQFLDEVTEEIARLHAENKRLREEAEYRGTARLSTGTAVEAEAIVRRAREEANRIITDAQSRARALGAEGRPGSRDEAATGAASAGPAGISPPGASPLAGITDTPEWRAGLGRFLSREKEFLQGMALLIQQHAEGVKDDAQRARDDAAAMAHANSSISQTEAASSASPPAARKPVAPEQPVPEASAPVSEGQSVPDASKEPAASSSTSDAEVAPAAEKARRGGSRRQPNHERVIDLTEDENDARDEDDSMRDAADESGQDSASLASGGDRRERPDRAERLEPVSQPTAAGGREAVDADSASEDQSLRELFWGED